MKERNLDILFITSMLVIVIMLVLMATSIHTQSEIIDKQNRLIEIMEGENNNVEKENSYLIRQNEFLWDNVDVDFNFSNINNTTDYSTIMVYAYYKGDNHTSWEWRE